MFNLFFYMNLNVTFRKRGEGGLRETSKGRYKGQNRFCESSLKNISDLLINIIDKTKIFKCRWKKVWFRTMFDMSFSSVLGKNHKSILSFETSF